MHYCIHRYIRHVYLAYGKLQHINRPMPTVCTRPTNIIIKCYCESVLTCLATNNYYNYDSDVNCSSYDAPKWR